MEFIASTGVLRKLETLRAEDIDHAHRLAAIQRLASGTLHILPDAAWARRVRGEFANLIARREPARAHAVLTTRSDGRYMARVRAPLERPQGADVLCRRFGGNGRVGAAGIEGLEPGRLDEFMAAFSVAFRQVSAETGGAIARD